MGRAAKASINLDAIRHNYQLAKQLAPGTRAVAIVKADAYGHGAIAVARALAPIADAFGVACLEEAISLREAGIDHRLLLLEGFFCADELETIDRLRLDTVIHSLHQLDQLEQARFEQPIRVWLKLDTGMHRVGLNPTDFTAAYQRLLDNAQVDDVVLMSHFSRADESDDAPTRDQITLFRQTTEGLTAPVSLANSPAILSCPASHGDWIRPGMMLYGASPLETPNANSQQLQPAMTLSSELIAIRDLQAGDPVGYGTRFRCTHPTRVGVVAMGYGDGFSRHATNGTPVLVNGQRCPLIGRVSMDMLTVDITNLPEAKIGDPVVFWGEQLPVEEVARGCDSIPYALVTTLTRRIPREYTGD